MLFPVTWSQCQLVNLGAASAWRSPSPIAAILASLHLARAYTLTHSHTCTHADRVDAARQIRFNMKSVRTDNFSYRHEILQKQTNKKKTEHVKSIMFYVQIQSVFPESST